MLVYLEDFIAFVGIISVIVVAFQLRAYSSYKLRSSGPTPEISVPEPQYTSFSEELAPQVNRVM